MFDWTVPAILMVLALLPVLAWLAQYRQQEFSGVLAAGAHFEAEIFTVEQREHEPPAGPGERTLSSAPSLSPMPSEGTVDPVLMIRQACLAMETVAQRRGVDLLRPFHISVPPLTAERGPLLSLLKAMLQNALESTPKSGAVICSLKLMPLTVHFVVSDSSGYAEDGAVLLSDNGWRAETIRSYQLVAEALGGHLSYVEHPGEGVVMDLAFERQDVEGFTAQDQIALWSEMVGNDHADKAGPAVAKPVKSPRVPVLQPLKACTVNV